NFAHGDGFMRGSWMTLYIGVQQIGLTDSSSTGKIIWGLALTLVCAAAFCALLNAAVERIAYRPLRNAPRLAPLITAIGMSFILQDVGLKQLGSAPVSLPNILPTSTVFTIGGNAYGWDHLIVALSCLPVLAILVWLVQRTRRG